MNQEDKDQIVSQLRKVAGEKRDECDLLETKGESPISFAVLVQANTFAKLADIFESLRTQ